MLSTRDAILARLIALFIAVVAGLLTVNGALAQGANCDVYKRRLEAIVQQEGLFNSIGAGDVSPEARRLEQQYYACLNQRRPNAAGTGNRAASRFPGGVPPSRAPDYEGTIEDMRSSGKTVCPAAADGSFMVCNPGWRCSPDGGRCLRGRAVPRQQARRPAFVPVRGLICDYNARGKKVCRKKTYR